MVSHSLEGLPRRRRASVEELRQWLHVMRCLPSVRVDKIVAVRAALHANAYDSDEIVSVTIQRLEKELGLATDQR